MNVFQIWEKSTRWRRVLWWALGSSKEWLEQKYLVLAVSVYVHMCACIHACVCVHACMQDCVCMGCVCVYMHVWGVSAWCMCVCTCIGMCVYAWMCVVEGWGGKWTDSGPVKIGSVSLTPKLEVQTGPRG